MPGESAEGPCATEEGSVPQTTPERTEHQAIFNDISRFKDKYVTLLLYGGLEASGKLVDYDEAINCTLIGSEGISTIVLGRSVLGICMKDNKLKD